MWDVITGQQVAVYRHHRSVVRDCDWHPHRPMLATVGWDGNVVQWQDLAGEDEEKGGEGGEGARHPGNFVRAEPAAAAMHNLAHCILE